jgi:hypothetical protein
MHWANDRAWVIACMDAYLKGFNVLASSNPHRHIGSVCNGIAPGLWLKTDITAPEYMYAITNQKGKKGMQSEIRKFVDKYQLTVEEIESLKPRL